VLEVGAERGSNNRGHKSARLKKKKCPCIISKMTNQKRDKKKTIRLIILQKRGKDSQHEKDDMKRQKKRERRGREKSNTGG